MCIRDRAEVNILTPSQFRAMLAACPTPYLPYLLIGGMCGLRTSEMFPDREKKKRPLQWEDIKLDHERPHLEVRLLTSSKKKRRRIIPIAAALAEWLRPMHKGTGQVLPNKEASRRNHSETTINEILAAAIGKDRWEENWLRHSYASYRVEQTKDLGAVSIEMGNSITTLRDSYMEAVLPGEAEEWWSISPETVSRRLEVVA